jgi:hypothetical protein
VQRNPLITFELIGGFENRTCFQPDLFLILGRQTFTPAHLTCLYFASWQRSFNTTTLTLSFFAFSSLLHVVKRDKTPLMIDLSGIEEL